MPFRVSSPVFVGRGPELERMAAVIAAVREGTPAVVLVAGEAGVGKTRFMNETADRAAATGVRTITGGCVQLGSGSVPFAPVIEALRRLEAELPPGALIPLVGDGRDQLARLLPSLAPTRSAVEPIDRADRADQGRLFEATLGLLTRLAATQPLMLVLEDIHWADESTLELLSFLARNLRATPVVVAATYRSDELHRRHPLLPFLAEIERGRRVERIELHPFDPGELANLVASISGQPAERSAIDALYHRSNGNAFFAEELLGSQQAGGPVPLTLREVLAAHVAELGASTQELLRVASAGGPRIGEPILAVVAGQSEHELEASLREAVDRHILILTPGGDFAFRHALLQEAVALDCLPGERKRFHARYAAALASDLGDGDELARAIGLAYHWDEAGDHRRALPAYVTAADAAAGVFAFAEAHRLYERAIELWQDVPGAGAVAGLDLLDLFERAAVAASVGAPARAVALLRKAISLTDGATDPGRAGLLQDRLGRFLWMAGDGVEALEACRLAVALVPASPPSVDRSRVLAGLGRMLMVEGSFAESRPVCEEAVVIARLVGAEEIEADALISLGTALGYVGDLDEGLADLRNAGSIALRLGSVQVVSRAHGNAVDLLTVTGRFDEAVVLARADVDYAESHGLAHFFGVTSVGDAVLALYRAGRWSEAAEALQGVEPYEASGLAAYSLLSRHAMLDVGRGRHESAHRLIDRATALAGRLVDPQWIAPLAEAAAELALWDVRAGDALQVIRETLSRMGDLPPGQIGRVGPLYVLGLRACSELALLERAGQSTGLEGSLAAVSRDLLVAITGMRGIIARERPQFQLLAEAYWRLCQAEAGRRTGPGDPEQWRAAADALNAVPMPYPAAYALWREAEARLAAREPRTAAARPLLEAAAIAGSLDAQTLARAIAQTALVGHIDLGSEEVGPSAASAEDQRPFGLTVREQQVLELVAAGRSNRQIAGALFISEKTAGVHVSNILGKLGVARRTEAAAMALRYGLTRTD